MGLANAALMTTVLLWGSMLPVLDVLLRQYDPFTLNVARYALAIPLSLGMLRLAEAGWFGATPRMEQLLGGALIVGAVIWVQTQRKAAALAITDKPA